MAQWVQLGLQDGSSLSQEKLVDIHDYIMVILLLILGLVAYMLLSVLASSFSDRYTMEGQMLEFVWTVLPAIVLVSVALPSLQILYLLDEVWDPDITLKAVGHQWYWSYEYDSLDWLKFDSYMTPSLGTSLGDFRLLDVDNRVVLPWGADIRVLVTAADVIHSWTVPSLGVKADAIPGRLNQMGFWMEYPGLFFGQCSEICGANHSFMPIVVESVDIEDFIFWGHMG
uniref:Cytochrome c oxidase subunit 2 n=1 Tax=Gyge ovalis TaxID=2008693 RepID=A0A343DSC8_9CRUS|nr:cytochrome c oxidase subunit II [Gyge ovalis]ASC43035.1 cytochrome c oxidase subunit II [Gyge ovalis]